MINSFNTAWIDSLGTTLLANTVKAMLVNNQYTPDPGNHANTGSIPAAAIVAEQTLQNKRFEQGRFYADDLVFTGIASATNIETLIIYDDVTKLIIVTIQDVNGLSVAANGTDGQLKWATDCAIFTL